jgi:hypothetical protein
MIGHAKATGYRCGRIRLDAGAIPDSHPSKQSLADVSLEFSLDRCMNFKAKNPQTQK